ncbi:MAG: membrane protein insertase YidC [bacterium]|nr:membrane protein insertase YidC [bacterium]
MDKKTVIALAVMLLIILIWPYYVRLINPPPEPSQHLQKTDSVVVDTARIQEKTEPAPESVIAKPGTATSASEGQSEGFTEETQPQTVIVETPLFQMKYSTRGGVLTGCRLLNYPGKDNGVVQLIRPDSDDNLNLILFSKGHTLDMKSISFKPDAENLNIPKGKEATLTFRAETAAGGWVQKQLVFRGDEYRFEMKISAGNLGEIDPNYSVEWGSGLAITEVDTAQDIYYSEAYAYMGGELEKFSGKGDKDLDGKASGKTEWTALRNKYFEVAILPLSAPGEGVQFGIIAQPMLGKHRPKVFKTVLDMNGRLNEQPGSFAVYCGPLDQKLITQVNPRLEETMNWGWSVIEPFSKMVLWSLKGLHTFIPNYVLVLILFSVLVKIIVWPLTQKSTRSMARMASVQPKMKEIQEKYKGNPEKLNKATMQLYKDEGVNPFSSCWPTLLQMPLLYALFIIFRSTIELRQAPFIFWIKDLSMPDIIMTLSFSVPLYGSHVTVLPILMGVTQFLMSKQMITDPRQKATMYMMPVFMVLIFNNFPSGLSLYYALFNLWTYLQQDWLKRKGMLPQASPAKS